MKKVLLVLAVLVAAFLGVVATRPDTYHVERSTEVKASPEAVFAFVGDLKTFPQWSPWQKRDPNVKITISTPSTGVGASYAWEGNKEVGKGRMTIIESTPPVRTKEKLEFIEPFPSIAEAGFEVKPAGTGASTVTWSMDGKNNLIGKAFSLFMDMDKMIGKDFEDGLASLKKLVEAAPAAAPVAPAAAVTPPPGSEPAKTATP
jgi:hypothetical protein